LCNNEKAVAILIEGKENCVLKFIYFSLYIATPYTVADLVCNVLFTIELTLRLLAAASPRSFLTAWNIFDAVIIAFGYLGKYSLAIPIP
jgi:hypothetical protein